VNGSDAAARSTLDLVVPWGQSALDIHDTALLVPMFQDAVKDTHEMWKREMEERMQEKLSVVHDTLRPEDAYLQRAVEADQKPPRESRKASSSTPRSLEQIKDERSKLATKGEILSLDSEVQALRAALKDLQKQLDTARDNLPLFLRQQTQRDIDEIGDRFVEILKQRQRDFRLALEGVRDAAAVAVADEVARVRRELEKQVAAREQASEQALQASREVAKKANTSLVSDRDMREATLSHLARLIDKVHSCGIDPASDTPIEDQVRALQEQREKKMQQQSEKRGALLKPEGAGATAAHPASAPARSAAAPAAVVSAGGSAPHAHDESSVSKLMAEHEAEVAALKTALQVVVCAGACGRVCERRRRRDRDRDRDRDRNREKEKGGESEWDVRARAYPGARCGRRRTSSRRAHVVCQCR